ncbi:lysM and putative peptidoglycan-binding domain-containing protein 1-like isoform X6 [Myxocyprinus asiaticus]|uniref:lysM and putative peptidoglycan-binding domain-containing protein 1-like isoform X6 n=1 Tax=Myxocyprinus asiaticus TaxID=70543 RepID=UPI00222387F0|nr:lysM and putative peptidoglycan-binding domain-containing protein 1-like isoform X6 [Myxocyprinus asiaticus]
MAVSCPPLCHPLDKDELNTKFSPVRLCKDCHLSMAFLIGVELTEEETSPAQTRTKTSDETYKSQTDSSRHEENAELSPVEYLKKIDSLISQSKQAAVKRCQEGEKQFSSMEQLYFGNLDSSKASTQQAVLGDVPITITRRTRNLRDREDEIFQL